MSRLASFGIVLVALLCVSSVQGGGLRSLKQANQNPSVGSNITITANSTIINAIAITPVLPYPQTGYYCNVSGDSRLAVGAFFPLTVRVPVGLNATVIFANITGTIPGTGNTTSFLTATPPTGSSVVQQSGNSSSSVVQQPGTSVVQQPGTSVVQQPGTSVVQQPGTSVVQQPGTSVVQQPGTSVVQQPNTTTSVVQQPGTSVVQQPGTSVVQQPGTSVVQQPNTTTVVQQPTGTTSIVQQQGRKLLQTPAPIEYISNNGSTGQPQLSVLSTVEGVPNIVFSPTAAGQTASFTGALQVAVTTTNDGFGSPYIPYQVDARLSPNCGVQVNFIAV